MTIPTINPGAAPAIGLGMTNVYLDTWTKLAALYKEAMDANAEHLMVSSGRIVQEHAMQALAAASQSCAEALAKNAALVQQQSLQRMSGANQRAFEIMGQAFMDAMMGRLQMPGILRG
jgi:hypothetical protein